MALSKQRRQLVCDVGDLSRVSYLHHDLVDIAGSEQAHLTRAERNHDRVVLVLEAAAAFAGQDANDRERHVANANQLADW